MGRRTHETDDGSEWSVENYLLRSLTPAAGLLAIWADDRDGGGYVLATEPVHYLAVADVEEVTYRAPPGNALGVRIVGRKMLAPQVVALDLADGYWHVCQESENFAGLCPAGADPYDHTGELLPKYLDALYRPDGAKVEW